MIDLHQPAGAFLRRHWRKLALPVALLVAFAWGRGSQPEPEVVERVEYRDRVVEKIVEVKTEAQARVVYRDRVIKPDGTRHEREVERTDSTLTVNTATDKVSAREGSSASTVTAARPQWRAGALVGADLGALVPTYGAIVERRLVGPISVGAWALHRGPTAGVALTVEW